MTQVCSINNKECNPASQHWSCRDYFGISGYFCGVHFSMIQHDSYRNPVNPLAYEAIKTVVGLWQANAWTVKEFEDEKKHLKAQGVI